MTIDWPPMILKRGKLGIPRTKWRCLAGKRIYKWATFSSRPLLITRGYIWHKKGGIMPKILRIYWEYIGIRYLSKRIDSNILSLDQSGTMMEQWIEHRPYLPIAISKNGGISLFSSIPVRQQKQTKFGQGGTFRIVLQFYLHRMNLPKSPEKPLQNNRPP